MVTVMRLGRAWCPGGRRCAAGVVAVLAACGVAGAAPSAALAGSSSGPRWTKQAPATSPPGLFVTDMAYDAATGTAVLFGGETTGDHLFGGTWTWNGTIWTKRHPATSPPAQSDAAMAYDAATGTVVLFGEHGGTWTWDGMTWTKQHPAASPSARIFTSMAYDAATGTVVLFGGRRGGFSAFNDTWTWDGTTWTKRAPAASPSPRKGAVMAYDAATGTVVLFGGLNKAGGRAFNDTFTWNGTTWTKQATATGPSARWGGAMAYDAATGTVVLFGGVNPGASFVDDDTWTWG